MSPGGNGMNINWIAGFVSALVGTTIGRRFVARRYNVDRKDRIFYIFIIITLSVISGIMFNFRDYFVEFFNAEFFCSRNLNSESYSLIFPKIVSHCDILTQEGIYDKYVQGIVVIFDFYFVCIFLSLLPLFIIDEIRGYEESKIDILKESPFYTNISVLGSSVFVLVAFIWTFVWSPLIADDDHRLGYVSLLSDYGIGAIIQTGITVHGSYVLAATITTIRVLKERSGDIHKDC